MSCNFSSASFTRTHKLYRRDKSENKQIFTQLSERSTFREPQAETEVERTFEIICKQRAEAFRCKVSSAR